MKVGDLVRHTPTGNFVTVLELDDDCAFIYFISGDIVGYKAWYSKNYLKAVKKCP